MKKIMIVALSAMLALAGCGNQGTTTKEDKPQETSAVTKDENVTALKYHWNISLKANENLKKDNVSTLLDKRAQQENGAIQGLTCEGNNISFQFDTDADLDLAQASNLFSRSGYVQLMDKDDKMVLDSSNIEKVEVTGDLLSSQSDGKMILITLTQEGKGLLKAAKKDENEFTISYDGTKLEDAAVMCMEDGTIQLRTLESNTKLEEMAGFMNSSFGTYQFEVMEEPEKVE